MIQTELIERVKTNLQWLAEKMPEKFVGINGVFFWKEKPEWNNAGLKPMVEFMNNPLPCSDIIVEFDPKKEFSNSIGRIYKVAFGVPLDMFMVNDIYMVRFHPTGKFVPIQLESTTELSAQLEALCVCIEQERNGK